MIASRRGFLLGAAAVAVATQADASRRMHGALSTVGTLVPSAAWAAANGAAGSGLTAAGVNADPTSPTRTTCKPMVRILTVSNRSVTGLFDVYYTVRMNRGLGGFDISAAWDGPLVAQTGTRSRYTYTDVNGNTKTIRCYKLTLNAAGAHALYPTGAATLAILVTPKNNTYQPRTFVATFYPRLPLDLSTALPGPQAAGYEHDIILDVDCNLGGAGYISSTTATWVFDPGTLVNGQAVTGTGVTAATTISAVTKQWDGTSATATVNNSQNVGSSSAWVSLLINAGVDNAGSAYFDSPTASAIGKAQGYLNTNYATYTLPCIRFVRKGGYRYDAGANTAAVKRDQYTRHVQKPGVTGALWGDAVHFPTTSGGATNYDAMWLEGFVIDLRRLSLAFQTFRIPSTVGGNTSGTNNRLAFVGCEIFHGANTFNDANASGAGMSCAYNGVVAITWTTTQDGKPADLNFADCNVHDIAGTGVPQSFGIVVNNLFSDISGTVYKSCPGAFNGNVQKRNAGFWSKLRTYHPFVTVTGPTGAGYMVQGTAGNSRIASLVQGSVPTWTPNSGSVTTTAARMAIPSSSGLAEGKTLYIATTSNISIAIGDNTVVATNMSTGPTQGVVPAGSVRINAPGAFVTIAGTETNISAIIASGSVSGVTVQKSVYDLLMNSDGVTTPTGGGVVPMTRFRDQVNVYAVTDPSWAASMIAQGATDPILDARYMGKNWSTVSNTFGSATATPPISFSDTVITASISTSGGVTTLHVTAIAGPPLVIGQTLTSGAAAGTKIQSFGNATLGGTGDYLVDTAQTVASTTMHASNPVYCWVDQHGDVTAFDNGIFENVVYEFQDESSEVGANIFEINGATFTQGTVTGSNASISGTTLTITGAVTTGFLAVGQTLSGTGVTVGTKIVSGSGLSWQVSASQTANPATLTAVGNSAVLDFFVADNTTSCDDVRVYGPVYGSTTSSVGGIGGDASHFNIDSGSYAGGGLSMNANWNPDAYCGMDDTAIYSFGGSPTASMPLTRSSFGKGTPSFPTGSVTVGSDACEVSTVQDYVVGGPSRFTLLPTTPANENDPIDWTPTASLTIAATGWVPGAFNADGSRKLG